MTLLGQVRTDIGPIQLHFDGEQFTTVRSYRDAVLPTIRQTVIVHGSDNAFDWFELCERRGAVFIPFPDPSQKDTP